MCWPYYKLAGRKEVVSVIRCFLFFCHRQIESNDLIFTNDPPESPYRVIKNHTGNDH